MDQLPNEIVEIILSSPRLTCEDLVNFSATSKRFCELVRQSTYIWKKKYKEIYPQFVKFFDHSFNDWYGEMLYKHKLSKETHEMLSTMPTLFYRQNELSDCDFDPWYTLMDRSPRVYHYIVLDLLSIIANNSPIKSIKVVPLDTPGNKTFQYYANKVLRSIRQEYISQEWTHFQDLPLEKQLLEIGATFIAQWCQPSDNIEWENISGQLDNISKQVISAVQLQYPSHPLLKVSDEIFSKWKLNNINSNQWNVVECRQIMKCLISVMYEQNHFRGNTVSYYMPENSYINMVLEHQHGLPITLAVIFESVARRVGLKCEPYSFPTHFLIKFTEGNGESTGESYYIDVFNEGKIIPQGCCPHNTQGARGNPHGILAGASPVEVVERMANNLQLSIRQSSCPRTNLTAMRSTLELIHIVNSGDLQTIIGLARLYMMHNIDTKPLENCLTSDSFTCEFPDQAQRVVHMLRDYELHRKHNFTVPIAQAGHKTRTKDLLYAVGMVMRHICIDINCVIYDWDISCMASQDWQKQIRVENLKYGMSQPFYKVIMANGNVCYTPQEHLATTLPTELPGLVEIGKHFSHFFETHYVPHAEKEQEYAADANVRHMFHQQIQFGF